MSLPNPPPRVLQRLTRDQRRDVLLMRSLGYSYVQIGSHLGITQRAAQYTCRMGTAEPQHKKAGRRSNKAKALLAAAQAQEQTPQTDPQQQQQQQQTGAHTPPQPPERTEDVSEVIASDSFERPVEPPIRQETSQTVNYRFEQPVEPITGQVQQRHG